MNNEIKEYIKKVDGITHTTLDPKGPGVIRIHLIPPKKIKLGVSWVVLLNGQDIIPISLGWAVLLREFINSVNNFSSGELSDEDISSCIDVAVNETKKVFIKTSKELLKNDLTDIIDTILDISKGNSPKTDIGFMKLSDYVKYMNAPHRMDLMISSMTENGHWHCNQKCLHCYAGGQVNANTEELSTEKWKKIIDKCRENLIPQLTFTGGEPTLRKDLVELVKYSEWFVTRLNTNGQLLTEELCHDLYVANLDNVQITFYSSDKEVHNELVGCNGFDKTVNGIKNAVSSGLSVSLNTPLCRLNSNYVDTIKYAHENLGINYFTCSGLILTGKALNDDSKDLRLSSEELLKVLKEAHEYTKENGCELFFTSPGWIKDEYLKFLNISVPCCGACSSNMAITPNGKVVPCQSWLSDKVLGDFLNDSWQSIWEGKVCKKLRIQNSKLNGVCPLNEMEDNL